ncbi:MAG: 50S ribosomal protein L34e [Candidatus Aenigmatarchaeota archaeon]|nr:50S ribosomal protein L34e [Candidatus Aenigmarchaeota archaeon]
MTKPEYKSGSWRKRKVKVPGGSVKTHIARVKPKSAKCGKCGKPLHGIPRLRQIKFRGLAKTQKRPERPYGGVLCSACMRNNVRKKVLQL